MVGFPRPAALRDWLLDLVANGAGPLTLYWHDHYLLCPSPHLLGSDGLYCGLPSVDRCANCLPHNKHCSHHGLQDLPMDVWRSCWQPLLDHAEVVFFSNSSRRLFESVFSSVSADQVVVRAPDHEFPQRMTLAPAADALHIGVIGRIAHHKGADVVSELGALLDAGNGERLTVFGTLDSQPNDTVSETGPFARNTLMPMLKEAAVNVLLVPSIWPETYSFVTREALSTGLPVLGYAIGAQGEALDLASNGKALPLNCATTELLAELRLAASQSDASQ
jgi:glycosyltransferase involved in cell wall biosynthesis